MTYQLIDRNPGWAIVTGGREVIGGSQESIDAAREAVDELNTDNLIGLDFADHKPRNRHIEWWTVLALAGACIIGAFCWFGLWVVVRAVWTEFWR